MPPTKDFPGTMRKKGQIWYYQMWIPGRGLKYRSTGEANYQKALPVARRLHAEWTLLSERPEASPMFCQAGVHEVARLRDDVSESQASRAYWAFKVFLKWLNEDLPLAKIDTDLLDRYQRYRLKTVSEATVQKETALILRLLRENGFEIKRPKKRQGKVTPGRPFTGPELKQFFEACDKYPVNDPGRYTPFFLLMLATGARPAELVPSTRSTHAPLLKKELDVEANTVFIRSAKQRGSRKGRTTKIHIDALLMQCILAVAEKTDGPYVFPEMHQISQDFDRILAKTEIEKIDPTGEKVTAHSFRHNFGTMLAEQGANEFIIQNVMRHADPRMTSRYTERATSTVVIDISPFIPIRKVESGQ